MMPLTLGQQLQEYLTHVKVDSAAFCHFSSVSQSSLSGKWGVGCAQCHLADFPLRFAAPQKCGIILLAQHLKFLDMTNISVWLVYLLESSPGGEEFEVWCALCTIHVMSLFPVLLPDLIMERGKSLVRADLCLWKQINLWGAYQSAKEGKTKLNQEIGGRRSSPGSSGDFGLAKVDNRENKIEKLVYPSCILRVSFKYSTG